MLQRISVVMLSTEQKALAIESVGVMGFPCSEGVVFVTRGFHFVCSGPSLERCSDLAVFRKVDIDFHVLVDCVVEWSCFPGSNEGRSVIACGAVRNAATC